MNLIQLQEKYPGKFPPKYKPDFDCPRCHGQGEYMCGLKKLTICFCVFVSPENRVPELMQITHDAFNDLAKEWTESRNK
jgi:transcription elongation factor Elf1